MEGGGAEGTTITTFGPSYKHILIPQLLRYTVVPVVYNIVSSHISQIKVKERRESPSK